MVSAMSGSCGRYGEVGNVKWGMGWQEYGTPSVIETSVYLAVTSERGDIHWRAEAGQK